MEINKGILWCALVLLGACGTNENKELPQNKELTHQHVANANVMEQAMDDSMREMHQAKQTGNADYDFSAMMIPHHKGAIAMAEALVKDGKSPELITFAKQVIVDQQREIKELDLFLASTSQTPDENANQLKKALMSSMTVMMDGMKDWKSTGNLDQDFIGLMIPHHQSAVEMARAYLPYAKDLKIKRMAQDIISAQEKEIDWLNLQR